MIRFQQVSAKIGHHLNSASPGLQSFGPRNYIVDKDVYNPGDSPSMGAMLKAIARTQCRGSVLDMGCGAGILGIEALYRGARRVVLADVNACAIANAIKNIEFHGLSNASAVRSDVFRSLGRRRFDIILFNMPFAYTDTRAQFDQLKKLTRSTNLARSYSDLGYQIIERFFSGLRNHLSPGGFAQVSFSEAVGNRERLMEIWKKHRIHHTAVVRIELNGSDFFVYRTRVRS